MAKVYDLHREETEYKIGLPARFNDHRYDMTRKGYRYSWRVEGNDGRLFSTGSDGCGLFCYNERTGEMKQLIGTCDFSLPPSLSGARKKLNRRYREDDE